MNGLFDVYGGLLNQPLAVDLLQKTTLPNLEPGSIIGARLRSGNLRSQGFSMASLSGPPKFLVFLDFDGVLHSTQSSDHEKFTPGAIHSVNRILDELEAHVVLSTAWRMDFSIDKFNAWFKGRIIGSTPVHELNLQKKNPRFHEILDFMESSEWMHIPWIAIDDKQSHFPTDSPAYITNGKVGITEQDANNIILMGKGMKFAQRSLLEHLRKMKSRR